MAKKKKSRKKPATRKKKASARAKPKRLKKARRAKRRVRGPNSYEPPVQPAGRGVGAGAAGQSGDIQGLSRGEYIDSESVEELSEEGQSYEAEVVSGVESAPEPDQRRVQTRRYIPPGER